LPDALSDDAMKGLAYPLVFAAIVALCFNACAPVRFNTELSSAGALAPGDRVTNLGATIGSVASVSRLSNGDSGVAFDVDHSAARLVLQDSIIVLRNDNNPSLELLNTNPISLRAPAGATIPGAANEQEADLLVASRMPGFNAGLATIAGTMSAIGAMPPGSATAPAANTLQQQLNAMQNWYAANSARNAAATAQQLQQINQAAAALERQLINQGRSAQAQQLRDQIDQLARTLAGALPPSAPPNTLVTPPVH
jgi:ABC-type transporter Mla subunit MlaD